MIAARCINCMSSASADSQKSQLVLIYKREIKHIICRYTYIFHPCKRIINKMRITATLSLVGSIKIQCNKSEFA